MIAAARYAFDSIKYADVVWRIQAPSLPAAIPARTPSSPPHNVAHRDARMQRVSECRRSFSHAGTLDGITAESIARACDVDNCQKSYSPTGCQRDSGEIRDPVGEDIYYFADSARRSAQTRPPENVERISPRGLSVIKRFGARISVLIIARSLRFVSAHSVSLSLPIYLHFFLCLTSLFFLIHFSCPIAPFVFLLVLDTLAPLSLLESYFD